MKRTAEQTLRDELAAAEKVRDRASERVERTRDLRVLADGREEAAVRQYDRAEAYVERVRRSLAEFLGDEPILDGEDGVVLSRKDAQAIAKAAVESDG